MYENYSVLFVDDEVNILNSLRRGLMDEEYKCYFANSGSEALEIVGRLKIDVIVTDMKMPVMNGLELLKLVAELSPMTVKLVLSGYTQLPQILATINQVDIFKFITKPWTLSDLIIAVNKSLDYFIIQEENTNYKSILETKNKSYQNILKRVNEVIDNAKKSSEILGILGKTILGFGKKYTIEERMKYKSIFNMQDEIFEIFSNAVTAEKKECKSNDLMRMVMDQTSKEYPDAKYGKEPKLNTTVRVNVKMFEATILTCMRVFAEEFKTNGFLPGVENDKKFKISLISPRIEPENYVSEKGQLSVVDVKIEFIKSVLKEVLSMCEISFQIFKINGSLIIGIAVEEEEEEEEKEVENIETKNQ